MKKTMEKALNHQIQKEYDSSYTYLSMAAYFEVLGFKGMASWMKKQSMEELSHAMKFFGYINDNNGTVILEAMKAPKSSWKSVKSVFEDALKHEQLITKSIDTLINQAVSEKDHATHHFLLGFATEQIEEENSFRDIIRKIELVGSNPAGLLLLDKELGSRA